MKTILNVIDTTGPGGAETVFTQLAAEIAKKNFRSIALIRGPGWVEQQLKELGVKYYIIDCKGSFNLSYLKSMVKLIRTEKIDIIQSHLLGSNVYSSIAGFLTRTPVISTFHGVVDISPNERFRSIKLLALRLGSRKIITVTDKIKKTVTALPILSESQVSTIYNGVDTNAFKRIANSNFRDKIGISNNEILIGSLGNIRKPKNYPLAIETIKKLHDQNIFAHYAIAGQGNDSQKAPLFELITKHNLEKYIHLVGFVEDTQAFLSSLDIFLMSSSSEGHPLALTQSMASETPIVSTKSGVEEIVENGVEALIVDSNTATDLAEKVKTIISNTTLRQNITDKALNKAQTQFSLAAMFKSYFTFYEE